jgi:HSP20 family protein
MSNVNVRKIREANDASLPWFEQIEKLFEEVRQRAFGLFEQRGRTEGRELDDWLRAERELLWLPPAELTEDEKAFHVRAAAPGFDAKDLHVTLLPNSVIVEAEIETKRESGGQQVLLSEFGGRRLFRRLSLPSPIDVEKTTATLEKGVLHLDAAKAVQPSE